LLQPAGGMNQINEENPKVIYTWSLSTPMSLKAVFGGMEAATTIVTRSWMSEIDTGIAAHYAGPRIENTRSR